MTRKVFAVEWSDTFGPQYRFKSDWLNAENVRSYLEEYVSGPIFKVTEVTKVTPPDRLLKAAKDFHEVMYRLLGGPLELACKYGPDFEPPDEEEITQSTLELRDAISEMEK